MTGVVPVVVAQQVVTAQAGALLQQARTRVWQQLLAVWQGAAAWHGAAATWQLVLQPVLQRAIWLQPVLQVATWVQQLLRVFAQHLRA